MIAKWCRIALFPLVLAACTTQPPKDPHAVYYGGEPKTLEACLDQAERLNRPKPDDGVGSVLLFDVKRRMDESRCFSEFGRYREAEIDNSLAVQKIDRQFRDPGYDDRSGYDTSPVHGGAHWSASKHDYGKFHCRMPGGLYSAC